jgi:hypothetical protein
MSQNIAKVKNIEFHILDVGKFPLWSELEFSTVKLAKKHLPPDFLKVLFILEILRKNALTFT